MVIPPGTVLGHYKIISQLGFGAMGEVYLAQDVNLRRSVALKILTLDPAASPQGPRRFIQEARTASALKHPNIAHIYEIGEVNGMTFITMEYVEGVTLREHGHVTLNETLDIAEQVASALVAAHAMGVVHRDLKPENIMISRDGYVKVLDFGLAKTITRTQKVDSSPEGSTASTVFTDPGSVVGTVTYMSPEQARGLDVDQRSDIWSLGVIMYEMIAGHTPFEGQTISDIISNILHREPEPMARFTRQIPESVEWLVLKALSKDREGRHQTAKELLSDIRRLKQRLSVEAELQSRSDDRAGITSSSQRPRLTDAQSRRSSEPMSSVEYIVSGISTHKKAAVATMVLLFLAAIAAVFGVIYLGRSWRSTPMAPTVARSLTRLTFGAGLQNGPSWSPDGKFIAYTSDHDGAFNIWVQPVGGGDPIQVTHSSSHDWQPDWSPDGNSIVFRSEREGGGLYITPAFGGREKKIASFGYNPQWSPDGSRILCLSPGDGYFDFPRIFIVNIDGRAPVEVSTVGTGQEIFGKQQSVGWHPDGKRISFLTSDRSFWTMPLGGGKPAKPDITPAVAKQLQDAAVQLEHFAWAPSGSAIFFEGESKGVKNLWKITVDPKTLTWLSGPERLTTGLGPDTEIAVSKDGKRLAFVTVTRHTRIWSMPFDPLTGQSKGTGQPLTAADLDAAFPDISPDGSALVFTARRQGTDKQELWLQSLRDNSAKLLAADEYTRFMPRWSPDGKYLAYSRYRATGPQAERAYVIVLLPIDGGEERLVTSEGVWRLHL